MVGLKLETEVAMTFTLHGGFKLLAIHRNDKRCHTASMTYHKQLDKNNSSMFSMGYRSAINNLTFLVLVLFHDSK